MKSILIALVLTGMAASSTCARSHTENMQFAPVVNPHLPKHVTFAGQKFDLDDELTYERLDRELTAMTFTHGSTLLTLKRANQLMPLLVPILKQNDVPTDLIYLCAIESSFNTTALSPAKAAGLWQFMPTTGKEYGLEVTDEIDERYHPIKATEAACRYLKNAYAKYGSWESVAASYNAGMGRISRELEAQGVESATDLWLSQETMRYPFRMLAMKLVLEHPRELGYVLSEDQLYLPWDYEVVEVSEPVPSWAYWAKEHGINYLQLRTFNPWIRSSSLTNKAGKTYGVFVPKAESLKRSNAKVRAYNSNWVTD